MSLLIRISFLLIFVSGYGHVYAQNNDFFLRDENQIFYGGVTLGGNFSTVDGDTYGGYKKAGFVGGATVYIRLLPKLLINMELLYTQKGSRGVELVASNYVGEFFEQYWLDLNYVEVPLILSYNFKPRWHIGVGGAYAQLIGNPREEIFSDQPYVIDPVATEFNKSDINFVLAGMYQVSDGWFIGGRWQRSVASIRDISNIPFWMGTPVQFNDLFSLRLIYLIRQKN